MRVTMPEPGKLGSCGASAVSLDGATSHRKPTTTSTSGSTRVLSCSASHAMTTSDTHCGCAVTRPAAPELNVERPFQAVWGESKTAAAARMMTAGKTIARQMTCRAR